jgi:NAD(P)-dependent dehydrogenase (short-subunit alcohol dehydrogenase family)
VAERLRNKVAIVTGAGRGIGEAIALSFAAEGAADVIAELNPLSGRKVEVELTAKAGRAVSVETDVRDADSVKNMVQRAIDPFGRVDILVNNAGINVFGNPLDTDCESWQQCMQTNLEGAWTCAQAVLPHLLEGRGGSIVNIASCHSQSHHSRMFSLPRCKTRFGRPDPVFENGYWLPVEAPGLGIEVDEKSAAKHPFRQETRSLQMRRTLRMERSSIGSRRRSAL